MAIDSNDDKEQAVVLVSAVNAHADADADVVQNKDFFAFPYEPYDIQLQLMQQLYATIDQQHIGIFESPTGTGKSISLICGALSWLTKHTDEFGLLRSTSASTTTTTQPSPSTLATDSIGNESPRTAEPSWLATFGETNAKRLAQQQQMRVQDALRGVERARAEPSAGAKKRKIALAHRQQHERKRHQSAPQQQQQLTSSSTSRPAEAQNGDEHLVDAYDSDRGARARTSCGSDSESTAEQSSSGSGAAATDAQPDFGVAKLIYCSRTHSQIAQFVREIRQTQFGDSVRVVTLGARRSLCVHPRVSAMRSDARMTDACLDMLQGSKSTTKAKGKTKGKAAKCPFYEKELLAHYTDYALSQVRDIEDLHDLGHELSTCAYYGTRASIALAQVVAMPYAMLLSKATRESLGVELAGNIVVLDEAHNIVEAVNSAHSATVTSKQLVVARRSLWTYFKKFEKRFKGANAFYIKQLLAILELLTKYLRALSKKRTAAVVQVTPSHTSVVDETVAVAVAKSEQEPETESESETAHMLRVNDFLFGAKVDHFNLFRLLTYLRESGLAKKLLGYMDTVGAASTDATESVVAASATRAGDDDDEYFESRHVSPLRAIETFLEALTTAGDDGRILVQPPNASKSVEGSIKFILLNPAVHFEEVVTTARSVILAGGTMQPVSQVIDQLFPAVPRARIDVFSCGHVIPPTNLVGFSLSAGPSQMHLEFTYARRSDPQALDELGRVLLNLARVVPGGIVVFFPSYGFEAAAVQRWQATTMFRDLDARKPLFREPRGADELARVLAQYSAACIRPSSTGSTGAIGTSGAMLLSVVGGKMSEGINFSDALARCVVMVGLPYPNARDAELVEKMSFLDKRRPGAGRQYYEGLCMKAVNQSIGRAIRHQRDYASIVLVDHRYASAAVRSRLPAWIQARVQPPAQSFGRVYAQLVQFYRAKQDGEQVAHE